MSAAMAWGYTMREWLEETPLNRAKCTAHMIHRNLRDQYDQEKASDPDKKSVGGKSHGGLSQFF